MARLAIRDAFQRLDPAEQAMVLRDLAVAHAATLSEEDRLDGEVFYTRRHEEPVAKPWSQVRSTINVKRRKRPTAR